MFFKLLWTGSQLETRNLSYIKAAGVIAALLFFSSSAFATTIIANDPFTFGVGARALGMGKTSIGVSDNITGIFLNPASLANIKWFQISSLSGKYLNNYNYVNVGFAVPVKYGAFGLGYVNSGVSFVTASTTIEGGRVVAGSGLSTYSYNNQAFLLSYGLKVQKLDLGASLKFFSPNITGPGISGGTSSGYQADFAINSQILPYAKTGLVCQNIFSFSKLKWDSGVEEIYPTIIRPGLSLKIIGKEGIRKNPTQELALNIDCDMQLQSAPTLHIGLEWTPVELLKLRSGIDQSIGINSKGNIEQQNNLTLGLGLNFSGFQFDYAYHIDNSTTNNYTHYFSLSYGIGQPTSRKKIPEKKKVGDFKNLIQVKEIDRSIVYARSYVLSGSVLDNEIAKIKINGKPAKIRANKSFKMTIPLEIGKNKIIIQGFDNEGELVVSRKDRMLRLVQFKDIAVWSKHKKTIEILAALGIVSGKPDGTFGPNEKISRISLLEDVISIAGIPTKETVSSLPFTDVSTLEEIAPLILAGYESELIKGYPDKKFMPKKISSAAEGAVVIGRLSKFLKESQYPKKAITAKKTNWAIDELKQLNRQDLLKFVLERFYPGSKLTKLDKVVVLSKLSYVSKKMDGLVNWDDGY